MSLKPFLLLLVACWVSSAPAASLPDWVRWGKADDGLYYYRVGSAQGVASEAEAVEAAFRDAEVRMRQSLPVSLSSPEGHVPFGQTVRVPGGTHAVPATNGWSAWALAGFERAECESVRKRLEWGNELTRQWNQLLGLKGQGRFSEAETLANRMAASYGQPLFPPVPLEAVQGEARTLKLGRLWGQAREWEARKETRLAYEAVQSIREEAASAHGLPFAADDVDMKAADLLATLGLPNEARSLYEEMARRGSPRKAEAEKKLEGLPPAPKAWPLRARWQGGPVGMLCAVRQNGEMRAFPELADKLAGDFSKAQIRSFAVPGELSGPVLESFFDKGQRDFLLKQGASGNPKVILAVLFDIARPGSGTGMFEAIDTRVRFLVLRPDGTILYEDQFKAMSSGASPSRWAEYAAGVLLDPRPDKYLVPKSPPL